MQKGGKSRHNKRAREKNTSHETLGDRFSRRAPTPRPPSCHLSMASPVATGKRRRPASALLSPPLPRELAAAAALEDPTTTTTTTKKKRRLESSTASERPIACRFKQEEKALGLGTKRRRSGFEREETTRNDEKEEAREEQEQERTKGQCGVRDARAGRSALLREELSALLSSPSAELVQSGATEEGGDERCVDNRRDASQELDDEESGDAVPTVSEPVERGESGRKTQHDRENVVTQEERAERARHRTSLRAVQVTPPPSTRMLDRKNPPPPPKRPKRRHDGGIVYARTYPRLALSPLVDDSPPTSPRVFRSLENEFAFAMQDTPEIRPRVRPAPRMARGSRRSTRAGASRAHRSLATPTSTMVLRSRQLNPSLSADGGKPENQREREQRDAQRRQ